MDYFRVYYSEKSEINLEYFSLVQVSWVNHAYHVPILCFINIAI